MSCYLGSFIFVYSKTILITDDIYSLYKEKPILLIFDSISFYDQSHFLQSPIQKEFLSIKDKNPSLNRLRVCWTGSALPLLIFYGLLRDRMRYFYFSSKLKDLFISKLRSLFLLYLWSLRGDTFSRQKSHQHVHFYRKKSH